jgi:hypothetical protein
VADRGVDLVLGCRTACGEEFAEARVAVGADRRVDRQFWARRKSKGLSRTG